MSFNKRLLSHFVVTTIATATIIFISIIVSTFLKQPTVPVTVVTIAVQLTVLMLTHIFTLYVVFNLRTDPDLDVRVNPYITLVEVMFNKGLSWQAAIVELLGQVLGSVIASVILFGTISNSQLTFLSPLIIVADNEQAWAWFLQVIASATLGFVYFHNYYYRHSFNLALTVASTVGVTSAVVYPFIGATTHNPFRYLAACVAANSCSGMAYIYITGPLVGIPIGFVLSLMTQFNTRDQKRKLKIN